jgi:hypothetical protein
MVVTVAFTLSAFGLHAAAPAQSAMTTSTRDNVPLIEVPCFPDAGS